MTTATKPIPIPHARSRALYFALGWLALLVTGAALIMLRPAAPDFPDQLVWGLAQPVDAVKSWVIANRMTSPLFLWFFDPISDFLDFFLRGLESLLLAMPWTAALILLGAIAWRSGGDSGGDSASGTGTHGRNVTIFSLAAMLLIGTLGLWDETMRTIALMGVAVFISLALGIPLGILTARSARFDSILRPVLDAMQVMPAFVYLIPVVLFFGIARVPAVIATVIYALPPAVRMTALGIRQVSAAATEAADAFGATPWQKLRKVQIPLAMPTILMGVNQTIMMALGIVVIAAMIGAGGLGNVVLQGLQRQNVGSALQAGIAIVLVAMTLDRITSGLAKGSQASMLSHTPAKAGGRLAGVPRGLRLYFYWASVILAALLVIFLADAIPVLAEFPDVWRISFIDPVNRAVDWMRDNLYQIGDLPLGTGPASDFIVIRVLNPLRGFLVMLPWIVVVAAFGLIGWQAGGWRLGILCALLIYALGGLNMWQESMDTLSQVLIAALLTILIGVPLGLLAAHSALLERIVRPALDFLQTIPPFVYLVPVIILFNPGRVPGLIAAVLYALAPIARLTTLGIQQVPANTIEAARAFGSTNGQVMRKVQIPLARPSILLGMNQSVMMVLAMVIIAGLVGGGALGFQAVLGLARGEIGTGAEAGLAIVALAVVLDRITQAWAREKYPQ